MNPIELALETAMKAATVQPRLVKMATDEQVAAAIVKLGEKGYRPSPQIVEPIRAYLSGYGVLITGETGVGKTMLMRLLGAKISPATRIAEYGLDKIDKWYSWTDGHAICIDDLGAERTVSEYGNKDEVLKHVVAHRCEAFYIDAEGNKKRQARTHITTNRTAEQIVERYGDRTLSRILGMCKTSGQDGGPFRFDGGSQRAPEPVHGRDFL
jgi:Flp pilus assembly CpaF family ATPase